MNPTKPAWLQERAALRARLADAEAERERLLQHAHDCLKARDDAEAKLEAAMRVVKAVADVDPWLPFGVAVCCVVCEHAQPGHSPACPWLAARALVAE